MKFYTKMDRVCPLKVSLSVSQRFFFVLVYKPRSDQMNQVITVRSRLFSQSTSQMQPERVSTHGGIYQCSADKSWFLCCRSRSDTGRIGRIAWHILKTVSPGTLLFHSMFSCDR